MDCPGTSVLPGATVLPCAGQTQVTPLALTAQARLGMALGMTDEGGTESGGRALNFSNPVEGDSQRFLNGPSLVFDLWSAIFDQ
jgi:hypothetical protein